jgi:hypothetical protein
MLKLSQEQNTGLRVNGSTVIPTGLVTREVEGVLYCFIKNFKAKERCKTLQNHSIATGP